MTHVGTFLHISDIHFKHEGAAPDLDGSVREKLLADLTHCVEVLGTIDGIFVSGDIAHAAQESEYAIAEEWLNKIIGICKCDKSKVVLVPGNHDVNREQCKTMTIEAQHDQLRRAKDWHELDAIVAKIYKDTDAIEALYRPFSAYRNFAILFGCDISKDHGGVNVRKEIPTSSGETIRAVGINSCWVSDSKDDKKKGRKLCVTSHQLDLPKDDSVVSVSVCHHPPDWLMEGKAFSKRFEGLFTIQLFGHKHVYRAKVINNSLRIHAGSVNPERKKKSWLPSYNIFKVSTANAEKSYLYEVNVMGRVWNLANNGFEADAKFGSQGTELFKYKRDKPRRLAVTLPKAKAKAKAKPARKTKSTSVVPEVKPMPASPVLQKQFTPELYYAFLKLSHVQKLKILLALGVHAEGDRSLPELEQYKVGMERIIKNGLLAQLEKLVGKESKP